jgi:hypothetical protein
MNNILTRIENAKTLWSLFLPSYPAPDDPQLCRWVHGFTDAELEHAFGRAAVKARRGLLSDSTAAYRYTSGVLVNERKDSERGTGNG